MHFLLVLNRGSHISRCPSVHPTTNTVTTTTTAINNIITIFLTILFFTSVRARVIGNPPPRASYQHPEELLVVEEFKRRILDHMGLSAPPSPSGEFQNASQLREMYSKDIQDFLHTMQQDGIQGYHDNNQRQRQSDSSYSKELNFQLKPSVKPSKLAIIKDRVIKTSTTRSFQFTRPSSLQSTQTTLKSATLRLRIKQHAFQSRRPLTTTKSQFHIKVFLVKQQTSATSSNSSPKSVLLHSSVVTPNHKPTVIKLQNLTPHISPYSIFNHSSSDDIVFNVSIIEIPASKTHPSQYRHNNENKTNSKRRRFSNLSPSYLSVYPVLDVKLVEKVSPKSRSRRNSDEDCNENSPCCRKSIYISFEDIGWDNWVLSPEGYTAYYCKGGCPSRYKAAGSFSAIKGLLHEQNPDSYPAPVCAASSYTSVRILQMGENNLFWMDYPDMVVTNCSCY